MNNAQRYTTYIRTSHGGVEITTKMTSMAWKLSNITEQFGNLPNLCIIQATLDVAIVKESFNVKFDSDNE